MAPKRSTRVMGAMVRTTRKVVQETIEVSVVKEKDATAGRKKVVEVKVQDTTEMPQPQAEAFEGEREGEAAVEEKSAATGEKEAEEAGVQEKKEQRQPPQVETISREMVETAAAPEGEKHAVEKTRQREDETPPALESEQQPPQIGEERKSVEEHEEKKKEKVEGDLRAEEAASGKEKEETKSAMRRRRRKRAGRDVGGFGGKRGYKRYVFRVLKQVHPELRVSSMAMTVLDSLVKDMFERLAGEASRLSKYSGRATLSTREIQAAVRLVLPRELGEHALAEGNKAVANFMTAATAKPSSIIRPGLMGRGGVLYPLGLHLWAQCGQPWLTRRTSLVGD